MGCGLDVLTEVGGEEGGWRWGWGVGGVGSQGGTPHNQIAKL